MPDFNEDVTINGHDLVVRRPVDGDGSLDKPTPPPEVLRVSGESPGPGVPGGASMLVGAENSEGRILVHDSTGRVTVTLQGGGQLVADRPPPPAAVQVGAQGADGRVLVFGSAGRSTIALVGGRAELLLGSAGAPGQVTLRTDSFDTIRLEGGDATISAGASSKPGHLVIRDGGGRDVLTMDGSNAVLHLGAEGNQGDLAISDDAGSDAIHLDGNTATLTVGAVSNDGDIRVLSDTGLPVVVIDGGNANIIIGGGNRNGDLLLRDLRDEDALRLSADGARVIIGASGNPGDLFLRDAGGHDVIHVQGETSNLYIGGEGHGGDIFLRDLDGADRIHLDGSDGDIKLMGADLAEDFETAGPVEPGMVVVAVGRDRVAAATAPLDRRVVGVASGAGGFHPGIRLATRPGQQRRTPVAIAGRAYCRVDARYGPITPGDLLATSSTEGHAMRLEDPTRAAGAIVGKALAPLPSGTGLVPVLLMLG